MGKIGKAVSAFLMMMFVAPLLLAHEADEHKLEGRWEFAVTTGDSPSQLTSFGQTAFSTYLLQNGNSLSNIVIFTTDTSECDTIAFDDVTVANSSVDHKGNVTVAFTVGNGGGLTQTPFQFVFTGVLHPGDSDGDRDDRPETITGTYQKTTGGCTQGSLGTSHPDGEFVATHFPDANGRWAGALADPTSAASDSDVPAVIHLKTLDDHSLSGSIFAPTLVNAGGVACFDGRVKLDSGQATGSFASGVILQLFGQDKNGTQVSAFIFASNPDGSPAAVGEDNPKDGRKGTRNDGSDEELDVSYEITGGPCDGFIGNDDTFKLIFKHELHGKPHYSHHP